MTQPVPTLTSLITRHASSHTLPSLLLCEFSRVGIQPLFLQRESHTHSVWIRKYITKQIFFLVTVSFQDTTPDSVAA